MKTHPSEKPEARAPDAPPQRATPRQSNDPPETRPEAARTRKSPETKPQRPRGSLRLSQLAGRDPEGLACPNCGCRDLRIVALTGLRGGCQRVRRCRNCGRELHTREY